jgi:nicotinamide phosphoribosyltransferase
MRAQNAVDRNSIVYQTDSYKVSHWLQFPPNTQKTSYYIESRGGADNLMFFGLQAVIEKLLSKLPTKEEVYQAEKFWTMHGLGCFNTQGWLNLIELGYFPLKIRAVKEGGVFKTKTVLVTVENTVDGFHWLPGWIETRLLQVWYPITVATKINECKKVIYDNLFDTGVPGEINFKLHSFGYRGVSSEESAELGAMAELVSFFGTDTTPGLIGAEKYYGAENMVGFSIPAAEHSTMTSWGKENEFKAYKNMLDKFATPGALVAVVSDSYNLNNAVINGWCGELKQQVLDSGVNLVVRPDSGNAVEVVLRTLRQLGDGYGYFFNVKGYKVLNGVRIIQGDSINGPESICEILDAMKEAGWSGDNVAFGMGGGSLQQVNRDTLKFAMKCSAIQIDGVWNDVFKEPFDAPWKASKKGRQDNPDLVDVYVDGNFVKEYTFDEIRETAREQLN